MRSYFGSITVAKQFGEIEDITAEVIYEGDKLETEIKELQANHEKENEEHLNSRMIE